jgi:hypothetical protein
VMMIWTAISWYFADPIITLSGWITTNYYVDILGNEGHPVVQMFLNNDTVFQDNSPVHTIWSLGLRSMKMHFNILASTIATLKYQQTTVVIFRG